MPHIALPADVPGIRGAMAFRPETARPLNALVEILLRGPNTLTPGERELIATYVSSRNCTHYCHSIHGAIAAAHLGGDEVTVKQVKTDFTKAKINPKLKALLAIAGKVQQDGKLVTAADVEAARKEGATDTEITTQCSSQPPSACTTVTSMDLLPSNLTMKSSTETGDVALPATAT
jgi:uncharacterized peroxidase-related enzyme